MSFAFIFPGQGSQNLKMMDQVKHLKYVKDTFNLAKEILGIDFLELLDLNSSEKINDTNVTQPLILTASYANYLVWLNNNGPKPKILAGHSLGEWTALVISNVIDFPNALQLVQIRANLMSKAIEQKECAMAAVLGLNDEKVIEVCKFLSVQNNEVIEAVNFNSDGQVVIAGEEGSITEAMQLLKDAGARKVQILPVSVPSHSTLMKDASDKFKDVLKKVKFNEPSIPLIHNYNLEIYTNPELIKEALIKQLYSPVLWKQTIKKILNENCDVIIESGPGKVLSSLNKRIDPIIRSYSINSELDVQTIIKEIEVNNG